MTFFRRNFFILHEVCKISPHVQHCFESNSAFLKAFLLVREWFWMLTPRFRSFCLIISQENCKFDQKLHKCGSNAWYVQTHFWRFVSENWKCLRGSFAPLSTFSKFTHFCFKSVFAHIRHYSHTCATFDQIYNFPVRLWGKKLRNLG